jgi:hypothetical protein
VILLGGEYVRIGLSLVSLGFFLLGGTAQRKSPASAFGDCGIFYFHPLACKLCLRLGLSIKNLVAFSTGLFLYSGGRIIL